MHVWIFDVLYIISIGICIGRIWEKHSNFLFWFPRSLTPGVLSSYLTPRPRPCPRPPPPVHVIVLQDALTENVFEDIAPVS
jgi:hypothetical protein